MNLESYRKQAGLTQTQLSAASGVSQNSISKIELGIVKNPKIDFCRALTRAINEKLIINVTIDDVFPPSNELEKAE